MAQQEVIDVRGIVEQVNLNPDGSRSDGILIRGAWYNFDKGDTRFPRPKVGDEVTLQHIIWTKGTYVGRYIRGIEIADQLSAQDPPEAPEEYEEVTQPTNGNTAQSAAAAPPALPRPAPPQPGTPRPGTPHGVMSERTFQARLVAIQVAGSYLKGVVDTDEDLLRTAEKYEAWILQDRPHFVLDD